VGDICMNCFRSPERCQCECGFVEFADRVERGGPSEDWIIADLREQLATTRAELEQQRTRAEAAEQELRMVSEAFKRHMAEGRSKPEVRVAEANALSALFDDVTARNKLAAIRAHLAGVDVKRIAETVAAAAPGEWKRCTASDGACVCGLVWNLGGDYVVAAFHGNDENANADAHDHRNADAAVALHNAASALLAAAREALEP